MSNFLNAIQIILCCLVLLFCAWMMHDAAVALVKTSEDFRDAWMSFHAQEIRANYELDQLAKDRIRIRELLKRMEKQYGTDKNKPK